MSGVHVIALVGESPGVVTELLWFLTVHKSVQVTGIELWTTQTGWAEGGSCGLAAKGPGMFAALRRLAPALPHWPHELRPISDANTEVTKAVQVFVPEVPGRALADVRSQEDADVFSRALHERVGFLVSSGVGPLLGSLAGGRKTMTAAMHSAFALYGRRTDRLCHVLLHRALENELRTAKELSDYAFPTEARAGVPEADQVIVTDVPFFPAGEYLAAGEVRSAAQLVRAARDHLLGLRAAASGRVEVRRSGRHAVIGVGDGVRVDPMTLLRYAVLLRDRSLLASEIVDCANALLGDRASTRTIEDPARNLRNLRAQLADAVGANTTLATLVPDYASLGLSGTRASRWTVAPSLELDLTELHPQRIVDEWFPRETTARRPRAPRLR